MNFREECGAVVITIVIIVISAGLMVCLPLVITAEQTDKAIKLEVQAATEELVNEIIVTGLFTREQYDNLNLTLGATELAYNIEITIKRIDGNPAKKTTGDTTSVDGTTTYDEYTTQVIEDWENNNGVIILNEGDMVYIKITLDGDNWIGILLGITSNSTYAEASGMVTKSGEQ